MKVLPYIKQKFFRAIFSLDKKAAFYALRNIYYEGMVRRLNDASKFNWDQFKVSQTPEKFEDLTGLFFRSPLTRGILRQDIDEAALLFKSISAIPHAKGVEIGRFYGGSTVLLTTAIGSQGKLYSIDIAPKFNDQELIAVLKKLGFQDRVKLIIDDANKIDIDEELDFAFIDGDHSYEGARLDHNKWGRKLKPGGLLIHHDMANSRPHSVQWNDLAELYTSILKTQSTCLQVVAEAGSMVVFRKTGDAWIDVPPGQNQMVNTEGVQSKVNSYLNRED